MRMRSSSSLAVVVVAAFLAVLSLASPFAMATPTPTTASPTALPTFAPSKAPTSVAEFCHEFKTNKACMDASHEKGGKGRHLSAQHEICQWRGHYGCTPKHDWKPPTTAPPTYAPTTAAPTTPKPHKGR